MYLILKISHNLPNMVDKKSIFLFYCVLILGGISDYVTSFRELVGGKAWGQNNAAKNCILLPEI